MSVTSTELAGISVAINRLVEATQEATHMVNDHWKKLHARNENIDGINNYINQLEEALMDIAVWYKTPTTWLNNNKDMYEYYKRKDNYERARTFCEEILNKRKNR